jgi:hypothetical protein
LVHTFCWTKIEESFLVYTFCWTKIEESILVHTFCWTRIEESFLVHTFCWTRIEESFFLHTFCGSWMPGLLFRFFFSTWKAQYGGGDKKKRQVAGAFFCLQLAASAV